jgi:hypothetical protein
MKKEVAVFRKYKIIIVKGYLSLFYKEDNIWAAIHSYQCWRLESPSPRHVRLDVS